jgi:hypothetical protein
MAKDPEKVTDAVQEACKELGIPKDYVFSSKVYDDRVIVVTLGGHKGVYIPGKKTERMPEYKVTGKGGPSPEKPAAAK